MSDVVKKKSVKAAVNWTAVEAASQQWPVDAAGLGGRLTTPEAVIHAIDEPADPATKITHEDRRHALRKLRPKMDELAADAGIPMGTMGALDGRTVTIDRNGGARVEAKPTCDVIEEVTSDRGIPPPFGGLVRDCGADLGVGGRADVDNTKRAAPGVIDPFRPAWCSGIPCITLPNGARMMAKEHVDAAVKVKIDAVLRGLFDELGDCGIVIR
jgi:hypothetical protein